MKVLTCGVLAVLGLILSTSPMFADESGTPRIAPATTAEPMSHDLVQGGVERPRIPVQRLDDIINPVHIDGVSARRAFEWWSATTHIPLVVNWDAIAKTGIDPDKPITLDLQQVPAAKVLTLMMRQLNTDTESLMFELSPWYLEVLTKTMANQRPVTRVYSIQDLLVEVPNFEPPGELDLNTALSSSGGVGKGGGGGSSQSLFSQKTTVTVSTKTREERGEEIAKLIRDTIEPSIWAANGGQYGSIKYFDGRLIVRAPQYVQDQIDLPQAGVTIEDSTAAGRAVGPGGTSSTGLVTRDPHVDQAQGGTPTPVSGLGGRSSPVSGTH